MMGTTQWSKNIKYCYPITAPGIYAMDWFMTSNMGNIFEVQPTKSSPVHHWNTTKEINFSLIQVAEILKHQFNMEIPIKDMTVGNEMVTAKSNTKSTPEYMEGQAKCGLKVWDVVDLKRKAEDYENGWGTTWDDSLNGKIGKRVFIYAIDDWGIAVCKVSHIAGPYVPYFVLSEAKTHMEPGAQVIEPGHNQKGHVYGANSVIDQRTEEPQEEINPFEGDNMFTEGFDPFDSPEYKHTNDAVEGENSILTGGGLHEDNIYQHMNLLTRNNYTYAGYNFDINRDPFEWELNSTKEMSRAFIIDYHIGFEVRFEIVKDSSARVPSSWKPVLRAHNIKSILRFSINPFMSDTNYMKTMPDTASLNPSSESNLLKTLGKVMKSYLKVWGKNHFQIILMVTNAPNRFAFMKKVAKIFSQVPGLKMYDKLASEFSDPKNRPSNKFYLALRNTMGGSIKEEEVTEEVTSDAFAATPQSWSVWKKGKTGPEINKDAKHHLDQMFKNGLSGQLTDYKEPKILKEAFKIPPVGTMAHIHYTDEELWDQWNGDPTQFTGIDSPNFYTSTAPSGGLILMYKPLAQVIVVVEGEDFFLLNPSIHTDKLLLKALEFFSKEEVADWLSSKEMNEWISSSYVSTTKDSEEEPQEEIDPFEGDRMFVENLKESQIKVLQNYSKDHIDVIDVISREDDKSFFKNNSKTIQYKDKDYVVFKHPKIGLCIAIT